MAMTLRSSALSFLPLLFACAAQSSGADSKAAAAAMSPARRQLERNERMAPQGTPEEIAYGATVYSSDKPRPEALVYAGEFMAASDTGFYLAEAQGNERVAVAKHIKSLTGESITVRQPRAGELRTGQVVFYSTATTLSAARSSVWFRGTIDQIDPIMGTIAIGNTRVDPKLFVLVADK